MLAIPSGQGFLDRGNRRRGDRRTSEKKTTPAPFFPGETDEMVRAAGQPPCFAGQTTLSSIRSASAVTYPLLIDQTGEIPGTGAEVVPDTALRLFDDRIDVGVLQTPPERMIRFRFAPSLLRRLSAPRPPPPRGRQAKRSMTIGPV